MNDRHSMEEQVESRTSTASEPVKTRLEKDEYFLRLADLLKERSTCPRRAVGCVLVDEHYHVMATGYNGTARGTDHCIDVPCPGALSASGTDLDKCEAIHAEQNALLQCHDVMKIARAYCTTQPCVHCMKLLMNTSVQEIYFLEDYPKTVEAVHELARKRGITLIHRPLPERVNLSGR